MSMNSAVIIAWLKTPTRSRGGVRMTDVSWTKCKVCNLGD